MCLCCRMWCTCLCGMFIFSMICHFVSIVKNFVMIFCFVFVIDCSLSHWLLEAIPCVEEILSGSGWFQLSHYMVQHGNSKLIVWTLCGKIIQFYIYVLRKWSRNWLIQPAAKESHLHCHRTRAITLSLLYQCMLELFKSLFICFSKTI